MKKFITAVFALLMLSAISTTAFAAELHQDSNQKSQDTNLTLNIAPTYVVTIPADASITFNAESTTLGTVKASHMQIAPDKMVVVSAAAGRLENQTDTDKTIPYKLMNGEAEFTAINLTDTAEKADLTVDISEADWNKAYAGDYKGTITFTISYENFK